MVKKERTSIHYEHESVKWIVILILGFILIIGSLVLIENSVSMECEFVGIRTINVRPDSCAFGFSDEYCPIPTNAKCKYKGNLIGLQNANLV